MAQSTPIRALADVTPVTFYFPLAMAANVALVFYDVAGAPLPATSGGSRDLTVEIPYSSYAGAVSNPTPFGEAAWVPTVPTTTVGGGAFGVVSLGAGGGALTITPGAPVDPGAATGYAIKIDRPQARPPV